MTLYPPIQMPDIMKPGRRDQDEHLLRQQRIIPRYFPAMRNNPLGMYKIMIRIMRNIRRLIRLGHTLGDPCFDTVEINTHHWTNTEFGFKSCRHPEAMPAAA